MNDALSNKLGWMLDDALRMPETQHAVLLSADGLLMAHSERISRDDAERHRDEARRRLDELEAAGGLRISISAGVVACPEHGDDAEGLLQKADEAMWRARAVGQPVGVGALRDRESALQDR